jgi:hypothetical protein
VAHVKLYSTLERHALALPAVCPPPVMALRITPPIFATQWRESAQIPVVVPVAALATALVPSAPVAVEALAGVEATGSAGADLHHVASAAQLDPRGVQVQGTSVLSAKHDMTAPKPNGGVRGIPPRGRQRPV